MLRVCTHLNGTLETHFKAKYVLKNVQKSKAQNPALKSK